MQATYLKILYAITALSTTVRLNTAWKKLLGPDSRINGNVYLEDSGKVPISMLRDAKLAALLLSDTSGNGENMSGLQIVAAPTTASTSALSQGTSTILASAQIYQKRASDTRLTQRPSTARGAEGGINLPVYKNLGKAAAFREEKKVKREETKLIGKGIRIAATLWKMLSAKNNKLVEVNILLQAMVPLSFT